MFGVDQREKMYNEMVAREMDKGNYGVAMGPIIFDRHEARP